ncbi:MAG TPA: AmmeMemoRadiSam system protein B [Vicinamibacteria bacterium]|nr:AmmeMemoRadiSam system protein B [Vicinamibacteria bacterium]
MSRRLAPLRRTLDAMPSPVADRPGLLLRDPFGYTEDVVIIPPPLVGFLRYFDGEHDEGDLAAAIHRATGELGASGFARRLADTLGGGGFLEDEELGRRRDSRQRAFADAPTREPMHAGSAYPRDVAELAGLLDDWLRPRGELEAAPPRDVYAVAAPHVSPEGGHRAYAAAYRALPADAAGRTVVVLGTSHYGAPERFGLTRKPYVTPFGPAGTDLAVVERLIAQGGEAVAVEDYCHAIEHSIEFQVVFLQHRLSPEVRVVPVLCGPFAAATRDSRRPEDDPRVARFLDALAELHAREGSRLLWVLAVDMAHVGRRYGDALEARAGEGRLAEVEARDRRRIAALAAGDAGGFWELVRENEDDLKWCGASPLYAFLKATAPSRGALLRYEQWNIDPASVVSFAALAFGRGGAAPPGEGGA